jgi:hypothetical protein
MRLLSAGLVIFAVARLDPCAGGGGGPTGTGGAEGNGADTINGNTGAGGGNAAATGGRCKATGEVCSSFYGSWDFQVATTYSAGNDPKTSSMSGTAVFDKDGTFVEDYTIGSLGFLNHYEGKYKLDGRFLTATDQNGDPIEYIVSCDDASKELVLTIPNQDCSPSVILGLKAKPK